MAEEIEQREDDDVEGQKHIHLGGRTDDEVMKDADDVEGQRHVRKIRSDDDTEGHATHRSKK